MPKMKVTTTEIIVGAVFWFAVGVLATIGFSRSTAPPQIVSIAALPGTTFVCTISKDAVQCRIP